MDWNCSIYHAPSISNFVLGVCLAVGIYVSYIPQHLKIINRGSSEGLSPTFLLFGSLSGFASFINIYLVSIPARKCCGYDLSPFQCANSLMSLVQVGLQAFGYCLILFLCVYMTKDSVLEPKDEYRKLKVNYYFFLIYAVVNVFLLFYFVEIKQSVTGVALFADISGLISTLLATLQYFPQIYTTLRLKHSGSLSLPMMLLQTPGGYIWSLSLYLQPGSKWSSWLPYFTAANLQCVLLIMCLFFMHKYDEEELEAEADLRIAEENIGGEILDGVTENAPLITA